MRKKKQLGNITTAKNNIGVGTTILSFVFPFVGQLKALNNIGTDEGRAGQLLRTSIAGTITYTILGIITTLIAPNKT